MSYHRSTVLAAATGLVLTGCATKAYVGGEVAAVHTRVDSVESAMESNQERLMDQDIRIASASETARAALERATEAGELAEGKLLYEVVLSNDVSFELESAELTDTSRHALDAFATQLKSDDDDVYLEIQGHTDSSGPEGYNVELGLMRAESVRRYLSREHSIPLHRMSVLSYGEEAPLADNSTREGRQENRRVVIVVLA